MSQAFRELIGQIGGVLPQLKALGAEFVSLGVGEAELALPYGPHLIGFPETGVIAGGAIYTLMDSAAGMAIFSRLGRFQPVATLDLRIDYLKPSTPGETLYGYVECYKMTRHIAFVRGQAYHQDRERPIAQVNGTFIIGQTSSERATQ